MTPRTLARAPLDTLELDDEIRRARAAARVIWRGQPIAFEALPDRIAQIDVRAARDQLYGAYVDALEALNPLYERRLQAWRAAGDLVALSAAEGLDPSVLAVDLERFTLHSETPYFAALRRYLALIGIEQGDATEADLWHGARGTEWAGWFGEREVDTAVAAAGRPGTIVEDLTGWRRAERLLAGDAPAEGPTAAVGEAYASLVGSPEWLVDELRVDPDEASAFEDFAAFVRLWRLRRLIGELDAELRLYASDEPGIQRAYYGGILSHIIGVVVAEEEYLVRIDRPFSSARRIESSILAAMLVEALEQRHGQRWWREPAAAELAAKVASAGNRSDALALLGYDELDWRPVLRQIRTRLIGEMSGYGGPNITTRAGTRKV